MSMSFSDVSSTKIDPYKKEYTLLGIAAAGVYAHAPNKYSEDNPVSITIYDKRLIPYLGDLAENGIVIDRRPCVDHPDFFHYVISGPMLKESLPDSTKDDFIQGIRTACFDAKECKGFDYVSLDLYLKLWLEMGARVGKRIGDTIQWSDGEVFLIPPASIRWSYNK